MARDTLADLRRRLRDLKCQKHKQFDDFEPIIKYIVKHYISMFPSYRETRDGSRVVYSFNVEGVAPISLEREHGSRDHIPPKFAKRAISGIEDVLTFIEASRIEPESFDDAEERNSGEGGTDGEGGNT